MPPSLSEPLSCLTRFAYLSVFIVCSHELVPGDTLAHITVRQLPIKLSLSTEVRVEPRNGTCLLFWSSARMHSLSASSDLLISAPAYIYYMYILLHTRTHIIMYVCMYVCTHTHT